MNQGGGKGRQVHLSSRRGGRGLWGDKGGSYERKGNEDASWSSDSEPSWAVELNAEQAELPHGPLSMVAPQGVRAGLPNLQQQGNSIPRGAPSMGGLL